MKTQYFRELAVIGARQRMIELKRQELELIKLFPELAETPAPEQEKGAINLSKTVHAWMENHPGSHRAKDVAKTLNLKAKQVQNVFVGLQARKVLKKVRRGLYAAAKVDKRQ